MRVRVDAFFCDLLFVRAPRRKKPTLRTCRLPLARSRARMRAIAKAAAIAVRRRCARGGASAKGGEEITKSRRAKSRRATRCARARALNSAPTERVEARARAHLALVATRRKRRRSAAVHPNVCIVERKTH